jgi:hypothetical protein
MISKSFKVGTILILSQSFLARGEKSFITEINPLLFINQGIGINTEYQFLNSFSIGGDLEIFRQTPYMSNGVNANRYIYIIAPKLHYYLLPNEMYGPFIGAKFDFVYSQSSISDSNTTAQSNIFYVAPVIQFGYRFITKNGFTLAAYIGAGVKSSNNDFAQSNIPASKENNVDWQSAQTKLNKNVSRFQPDYGLTFGYMF